MRIRSTAVLLGMAALTAGAAGQECGLTASAVVGGFASDIAALPGRRVAVARGMALEVYSLADPAHPVLVDRLDQTVVHEHWGRFERLATSGSVVCGVQHGWLNVFDTSGGRITRVASRQAVKPDGTTTAVGGMVFEGSRVYLTGSGVLEVLDVSDPGRPEPVARTATPWGAVTIDGAGGWVYTASTSGLRYADCTGPSIVLRTFALPSFWCAEPRVAGGVVFVQDRSSETALFPAGVEIGGSLGTLGAIGCPPVVAEGPGTVRYTAARGVLTAVDLADPAAPFVLGQAGPEVSVRSMAVVEPGLIAAVTTTGGIQVVDASDPAHMALISDTPAELGVTWSIARSGSVAWVAVDSSRVEGYDLSDPARPVKVSELFRGGGRSGITALAARGGLLVMLSGGPSGTTRVDVIDVTDARAPRPRGSVNAPFGNDSLSHIAFGDGLAAVANSLGSPIRLVDLSNPDAPQLRGSVPSGAEGGVALQGNLLLAQSSSRLSAYDLSDPAHPTLVRSELSSSSPGGELAVRGSTLAKSFPTSGGVGFYDIAHPAAGIPLIRMLTPTASTSSLDWSEPDLAFGGPGLVDTSDMSRAYVRFPPLADAGPANSTSRVASFPGFLALAQGADGLVVYPLTSGGPPALRSSLPTRVTACTGMPFELTVDAASETQPLAYQWYRLQDPIPGAIGPTLRFEAFSPNRDSGSYRCVISNACGTIREPQTTSVQVGSCTADFNCDGMSDWSDYGDYVDAFEGGDPRADTNGDGFTDFFDYSLFVAVFEHGC